MASLVQTEFNPSLGVKSFLSGTAFITYKNNLENIAYLEAQGLRLERNQVAQNRYIILLRLNIEIILRCTSI